MTSTPSEADKEDAKRALSRIFDEWGGNCPTPEGLIANLLAAGFKIMAREPTEAELCAGLKGGDEADIDWSSPTKHWDYLWECRRAMWDAAP